MSSAISKLVPSHFVLSSLKYRGAQMGVQLEDQGDSRLPRLNG